MTNYSRRPLVNAHCQLGENPLWRAEENRVYWTDIPSGRLYRYHLDTAEWGPFYQGPAVGGFTFQADGSLLLFRANEIVKLASDGKEDIVASGIDEGMARFNDVTADPEGRVFAGTIGASNETGGLYRVDRDGTVTRLFTGTGCSNGMGFSPTHEHLYWTDSTADIIYVFDYDRTTGELGNRRIFRGADGTQSIPDGLAVDTQGCVWSAQWDGHCIVRLSPRGETIGIVEIPVPQVTSLTFGGADLQDLFVTTAGGSDGSDTEDGTLYHVRVEVPGMAENRSRICL